MDNHTQPEHLNRREFVQRTAAFTSALAAASQTPLLAQSLHPKRATFTPLAPGAVRPNGWLGMYLNRQATLAHDLVEFSEPFNFAYWAGEEQPISDIGDAWWPWEQRGYWVDGAVRCAFVTGDARLLESARAAVDYTLAHAQSDGYLGPQYIKAPAKDFHRWPHNVFFRAVAATGDATNDPAIAEKLRRHFLRDMAQYGSYGRYQRDITNVEGLLWTYERTGDPRLLEYAEKSWADYLALLATFQPPGEALAPVPTNELRDYADLLPERVFANLPIHSHGCSYAEVSKVPTLLYLNTGKPEYLRFALAANKRITDRYMMVDGMPCTSEAYEDVTSISAHETCDMSDHTWSWGYLLMATGDAAWADRIERIAFNAAFGAIDKDWKSAQYFSASNQFLATFNCTNTGSGVGDARMAFRPNPCGGWASCCAGNLHRFFPNYVIRMWMHDRNGGLTAMLYGPSTVQARVGQRQQMVKIVQETQYPFEEQIAFTIHASEPVRFPLSLRIPAWCDTPSLYVNGSRISTSNRTNGFVTINRTFHPGDVVRLELPMTLKTSRWPENGIAFERGPLTFALPIEGVRTPSINRRYSTEDYPDWVIMPGSKWNIGLPADASGEQVSAKVNIEPVPFDPWIDPPITITVKGQELPYWTLRTDSQGRQFTPKLPDDQHTMEVAKDYVLVPYGSTMLRLTIFPELPDAG